MDASSYLRNCGSPKRAGEFRDWSCSQFHAAVDLTAARNETLVSTRWAKLRSVDYTAALSDNSLTRAVDATSANLSDGKK